MKIHETFPIMFQSVIKKQKIKLLGNPIQHQANALKSQHHKSETQPFYGQGRELLHTIRHLMMIMIMNNKPFPVEFSVSKSYMQKVQTLVNM